MSKLFLRLPLILIAALFAISAVVMLHSQNVLFLEGDTMKQNIVSYVSFAQIFIAVVIMLILLSVYISDTKF